MFRSLGNVRVNPRVGMLFIDFEAPKRLRVNGLATLDERDPLLGEFPGAQLIVRVRAEHIFPNCPRYIHRMQIVEQSRLRAAHGLHAAGAGVEADGQVPRRPSEALATDYRAPGPLALIETLAEQIALTSWSR